MAALRRLPLAPPAGRLGRVDRTAVTDHQFVPFGVALQLGAYIQNSLSSPEATPYEGAIRRAVGGFLVEIRWLILSCLAHLQPSQSLRFSLSHYMKRTGEAWRKILSHLGEPQISQISQMNADAKRAPDTYPIAGTATEAHRMALGYRGWRQGMLEK